MNTYYKFLSYSMWASLGCFSYKRKVHNQNSSLNAMVKRLRKDWSVKWQS